MPCALAAHPVGPEAADTASIESIESASNGGEPITDGISFARISQAHLLKMKPAIVNLEKIQQQIDDLSARYAHADPFPHAVIDDVLPADRSSLGEFPANDWAHWNQLGDKYQHQKLSCGNIHMIPEPFKQIIHELSEPKFLELLERITGIQKLIPDPYLSGGGLHLSGPGGILAAHTDFHIYRRLGMYRRINVLLYLNDDWQPEYGGNLTLYSQDTPVTTITPTFGRMAIFTTDDKSVHGFPTPVAEGKWRKSIALYYYTSTEAQHFSGDETTYWRQHEDLADPVSKARFLVYKLLLNISRGFSALAHVANPHQGMGLVKTILENKKAERKRTDR
jgi:Rps23 Pro-64 3,4-dihydroxylase Tpa1-like proline 4-hydroxylase